MSFRRDLRRHRRDLIDAKVCLVWTDAAGRDRYETGFCRDISQSGMRVELHHRIEPRSFVSFRVTGARFEGSASVRHCQRARLNWLCGLEFTYGLRWQFSAPAAHD